MASSLAMASSAIASGAPSSSHAQGNVSNSTGPDQAYFAQRVSLAAYPNASCLAGNSSYYYFLRNPAPPKEPIWGVYFPPCGGCGSTSTCEALCQGSTPGATSVECGGDSDQTFRLTKYTSLHGWLVGAHGVHLAVAAFLLPRDGLAAPPHNWQPAMRFAACATVARYVPRGGSYTRKQFFDHYDAVAHVGLCPPQLAEAAAAVFWPESSSSAFAASRVGFHS